MIIFIDESGTHTLEKKHLDTQYNVFVLGAVIFLDDEYTKFDQDFKRMKKELFESEDFIVHTAEISRPSNAKDQQNMKFSDPIFRKKFYSRVVKLMKKHRFFVSISVIKKKEFFLNQEKSMKDPYIFSFDQLLNNILTFCNESECSIYPEKRSFSDDLKLELSFLRTKVSGTGFYRGAEVSKKVKLFKLMDKKENLSGLQLIDLIVTPIGRHTIGKKPKPKGNEVPFKVIAEKILKGHFYTFPK